MGSKQNIRKILYPKNQMESGLEEAGDRGLRVKGKMHGIEL